MSQQQKSAAERREDAVSCPLVCCSDVFSFLIFLTADDHSNRAATAYPERVFVLICIVSIYIYIYVYWRWVSNGRTHDDTETIM